jgi:hypothetical protein
MSWIRKRGLETFQKQNPTWELRLLTTPKEHSVGLGRAPAGDWTIWKALAQHGGFRIDSDMIHLNPMRDEWLDYDMCSQLTSSGSIQQMAAVGVRPGHPLMLHAVDYCQARAREISCRAVNPEDSDDPSYQAFGVVMIKKLHDSMDIDYGNVLRLSAEDFCFYDWEYGPSQMWMDVGPNLQLPPEAVAVHWYGGSKISKRLEHDAHADGPSWLERLARDS